MTAVGNPIEAVLTLNATDFHRQIGSSTTAVNKFKDSVGAFVTDGRQFGVVLDGILRSIKDLSPELSRVNSQLGKMENIKQLSLTLKNVAQSVEILSQETLDLEKGLGAVGSIMESFKEIMGSVEVTVKNVVTDFSKLKGEEEQVTKSSYDVASAFEKAQQELMGMGKAVRVKEQLASMNAEFERSRAELLKFAESGVKAFNNIDAKSDSLKAQMKSMNAEFERSRAELLKFAETGVKTSAELDKIVNANVRVKEQLAMMNAEFERSREELLRFAQAQNQLQREETETANSTNQATQSIQRQNSAYNQGVGSANRMTSATNRLSKAMSSLRMIGTMVASMMVWNFASSLVNATRETVNSKSEMEGYFQMLHFSQFEINQFNKALDSTVNKFQRINKYSLGETISSIGVEFNLTTKEMEKAMPVVSMITSEYLRAGRNANEASLAVKDILQGEFQRLSRETGVKKEQVEEAGWSGDNKDVMGLIEALDKIGKSRNWDIFVTKANSLNDAVMILQNRFGEWTADMVNVVQPTILSVFNSLMNFGQGMSQSIGGLWKWLNGNSWGAVASKIGLVSSAIMVLMPLLTAWRSGSRLIELASLSLSQQLTALVFGINAETIATQSSSSAIGMKILGLNAQEVAESGVMNVIRAKLLGMEAEKVATMTSTEMNFGFVGSLYAVVTGEALAEAETLSFSGALAILTGTFLASPIGWFTLAVLGLASAFYVLTGGLDESWEKMKQFNETMKDTGSAQKEANEWLEQVKKDAGENSKAFQDAKDSVEEYTHQLQSASYWYNHSQTAYNGLDLTAQSTSKDILKQYGISQEDADEWNANLSSLSLGKSKYVKGEEVLNKQLKGENSNFAKDLDEYLKKVKENGGDLEEAYGKMAGNYENLAMHSYIANTTDSWWEWLWNSFYAGMDQFWIDWDKFWADPNWNDAIEGAFKIFGNGEGQLGVGGLGNLLGLLGIKIPTGKEITDYLSSISGLKGTDIIDAIFSDDGEDKGESWSKILGLDGLDKWITDGLHKIDEDFGNWLNDIPKSIFGDAEETWSSLGQKIADSLWNGFKLTVKNAPIISSAIQFFDGFISPLLDFVQSGGISKMIQDQLGDWNLFDAIMDAFLPSGVSASDGGSSDHPSFMEDVSSIVGFDVQSWIESFNSDPLGTLGIQLPQIDIIGLIKSLISTGTDGLGIGDWLGQLFNIDGIISYFTTNLPSIVSAVSDTASTVSGLFSNLKSTVQTHLTNIVNTAKTGFDTVKTNSINSITAMKDSVSGVIDQMVNAWVRMKDSILDSAKKIQDGVKQKFDSVKSTIGDFFNKLQNPSQWGSAGLQSYSRQAKPYTARRMFSPTVRRSGVHGAGVNPYQPVTRSKTMSIRDLVDMVGVDENVNVLQFLSLFSGGFGGWDFHEPAKKRIFDTGKKWKSAPPSIQGIGSVGSGFEVSRFWDGKPSFTFDEFLRVAEAIFSTIPYKFYYDSEWKGNWVSALLSGATNCSDGSDALIALASVFGFKGEKIHTTLGNGVGHFYARIGDKVMDTTNFQNHGSWSPLGGAGIPTRSANYHGSGTVGNKTFNIEININEPVYGVDDLDSKIQESVQKGLQAEFNDPYTIAI